MHAAEAAAKHEDELQAYTAEHPGYRDWLAEAATAKAAAAKAVRTGKRKCERRPWVTAACAVSCSCVTACKHMLAWHGLLSPVSLLQRMHARLFRSSPSLACPCCV